MGYIGIVHVIGLTLLLTYNKVDNQFNQSDIQDTTVQFERGITIKDDQKSHFYPMLEWDTGQYEEFAYYETDDSRISDFLNLRVAFPPGYDKNRSEPYPAILALHGTGESGRKWDDNFTYTPEDPEYDNNSKQLSPGGKVHYEALQDSLYTGIIIMPQSSYNAGWGEDDVDKLEYVLEEMIQNYNVDPDRIVIHGLSNGAKGAWRMIYHRPDLFAGALFMSGVGTDLEAMPKTLATEPIWLFQGDMDINPTPSGSQRWYDELVANGATPRYTLYDSTGHGTWGKAYREDDFFPWIAERDQKSIQVMGGIPDGACENTETLTLGFSAGFLDYQWMLNGVEIAGANERFIVAEKEGEYAVRFKRRTDNTWAESYTMKVYYTDPSMPEMVPDLEPTASTLLPSFKRDKSLNLITEPGFATYTWYKNGEIIKEGDTNVYPINDADGALFNPEDTGFYAVQITDYNGCTSMVSNSITISYDPDRPLAAGDPKENIVVYPNPFDDQVTVRLSDPRDLNKLLVLYDPAGKEIARRRITSTELRLNLAGYGSGIYILRIGTESFKLVK